MTHDELHEKALMAADVAAGEGALDIGDHGSVDEYRAVRAWIDRAADALREELKARSSTDPSVRGFRVTRAQWERAWSRAAAVFVPETVERDEASSTAMTEGGSLRGSFHAILREMAGGAIDQADIDTALDRLLGEVGVAMSSTLT